MNTQKNLSRIVFCQLFAFGAINPMLSLYLQDYLHFTGVQTGFILASSVFSSLISPIVAMYVMGKSISTRNLLIACQIVLVFLSLALAGARDFFTFLFLFILFSSFSGPTIGMVNSLCFQSLGEKARDFGGIRVWGTLGWIGSGWLLSVLWIVLPLLFKSPADFHPLVMLLTSFGFLLTMIFAFRLLDTRTVPDAKGKLFPSETVRILRKPVIMVLGTVYLLSSILDRFYSYGSGPFLSALGLPEAWILPVLSLGQITEILTLLTLSRILERLGWAKAILSGLFLQCGRFALFASGFLPAAIIGVSLNGFIFAYVYTAIIMYIDSHTNERTRSGMHQIIIFAFSGVSSLAGNIVAGILSDSFKGTGSGPSLGYAGVLWNQFWFVPAIAALLLFLFAWQGMRKNRETLTRNHPA